MRVRDWRRAIFAGAFFAGAVVIGAAANPGKTFENSVDDICESAVWPMIPAPCFSNEQVPPVYVRAFAEEIEPAKQQRGLGTDVASEKADLLQGPKAVERYRTIEIRGDGVSELRRVEHMASE